MDTYTASNDKHRNISNKNELSADKLNGDNSIFEDGKSSICFFSFNSRGFSEDKQDLCKILMIESVKYIPVLCNQENFLLYGNRRRVEQCLVNSKVYFKKAVKDSLHRGRAKNGMFIAIPKLYADLTKDVSPDHWRVQAITINTPNCKMLVINSYFPTDPKINDFDTDDLFSTLDVINQMMVDISFDSVIWMGDINAEFIRNSQFTKYINDFVGEKSLSRSWDHFPIDYTHSCEIEGKTYTSTLDHFFWSANLSESIKEAGALHLPSNTSDHCPIYCIAETGSLPMMKECKVSNSNPRISWNRGTEEGRAKFVSSLTNRLENLTPPRSLEECNDVHCKHQSHPEEIDEFLTLVLESITLSGKESLQSKQILKTKSKSKVPFWQENIQPYKEDSMFWHAVWESAGKPINTELHKVMKSTRNRYHYQIRKGKRMAETLKKDALIKACMENNDDIFKIIKNSRRTESHIPPTMDGISIGIEERFADIYGKLYNSIDDNKELHDLRISIDNSIDNSSLIDVNKVTPDVVYDAIQHLKNNKTDPVLEFNSDCLKNSPRILSEILASIFRYFLIHGHISFVLLVSAIIPLVKDKLGDVSCSDNYRSIAISSLILKVFDWVILILLGDNLKTDELQFGFQENTSTGMCTWLMTETIDYYHRHGSDVYACVMDMTKAFDLVRHSKLFQILRGKGVPNIFIRLLIVMYQNQKANVRWNGVTSKEFSIRNGVKQGAVLSPRLYCVYTDGLFELLRNHRTGCWVKGHFAGILGYADDLLLLSPTLDGLQEMVKKCGDYADQYNLKFSTHQDIKKCKTKCIAFLRKDKDLRNILLNGKTLPWVKYAKHLGCTITQDIQGLPKDIMEKRAQFINKSNELGQEFSYAHYRTKIKLNQIFNTSFYGSQLWDLFSKESERIEKSWNVSQRIILKIPRNSHRYFLEPLTNSRHIRFSLMKRFISFVEKVSNSPKSILRTFLNVIKSDCRSTTGKNLRRIMLLVDKTNIDHIVPSDLGNQVYAPVKKEDEWRLQMAKEIIEVKNRNAKIYSFSTRELDEILEEIMTETTSS